MQHHERLARLPTTGHQTSASGPGTPPCKVPRPNQRFAVGCHPDRSFFKAAVPATDGAPLQSALSSLDCHSLQAPHLQHH
eukprot:6188071-Alexandrium_andersonii.AAC.1